MTFARLRRGDWLALVAALALLLVMSVDWYTTEAGEQAREDAAQTDQNGGPVANEAARSIDEDAEIIASRAEKNAWQADAFADRLVLFALLATIVLAIASAFLRAGGVGLGTRWSPAAVTTIVGLGAAILLAARIVQKPAADVGAVVTIGAPIGLVCAGVIVIGARAAWLGEREGEPEDTPADDPAAPTPPPADERTRPAPLFDYGEPTAPVATASPPMTAEEPDPDWAPDWSEPPPGAEEPAPDAAPRERSRRRRGRRDTARRPRRF